MGTQLHIGALSAARETCRIFQTAVWSPKADGREGRGAPATINGRALPYKERNVARLAPANGSAWITQRQHPYMDMKQSTQTQASC